MVGLLSNAHHLCPGPLAKRRAVPSQLTAADRRTKVDCDCVIRSSPNWWPPDVFGDNLHGLQPPQPWSAGLEKAGLIASLGKDLKARVGCERLFSKELAPSWGKWSSVG